MTFHRYPKEYDGDFYIPSPALVTAVNTAIAVEQPLVVTGEPGTGKTLLASSIARRLGWKLHKFVTRSDHQARDCLYAFDALQRLYDAQVQNEKAKNMREYIEFRALGRAIAEGRPCVVLIDEIDKAPRDFPNDLLGVLEETLEFEVKETGEKHRYTHSERPFILITSNNERQLPDAFLRRCVYHHIDFPSPEELERILRAKLNAGAIKQGLLDNALKRFEQVRQLPLEKKPATGELIAWVKVLIQAEVEPKTLENAPISELFPGVLLKLERDLKEFAEVSAP